MPNSTTNLDTADPSTQALHQVSVDEGHRGVRELDVVEDEMGDLVEDLLVHQVVVVKRCESRIHLDYGGLEAVFAERRLVVWLGVVGSLWFCVVGVVSVVVLFGAGFVSVVVVEVAVDFCLEDGGGSFCEDTECGVPLASDHLHLRICLIN